MNNKLIYNNFYPRVNLLFVDRDLKFGMILLMFFRISARNYVICELHGALETK